MAHAGFIMGMGDQSVFCVGYLKKRRSPSIFLDSNLRSHILGSARRGVKGGTASGKGAPGALPGTRRPPATTRTVGGARRVVPGCLLIVRVGAGGLDHAPIRKDHNSAMSDKFDAFNRWAESTEANFLDSDNESPWNIAQKTWQACAAHYAPKLMEKEAVEKAADAIHSVIHQAVVEPEYHRMKRAAEAALRAAGIKFVEEA